MVSDLVYALKPEIWCKDVLKFAPDEWQTSFLRSQGNLTAMTSRQAGKSTICAAKVLHCALFRPGTQSAICSPTLRQSQLMSATIATFIKKMADPPKLENDSQAVMRFSNGSVIYSLPGSDGSSLRGYSLSGYCVIDEMFAFDDEAFVAIAPTISVAGGNIIACGTPLGPMGWGYDLWQSRPKDWEFICIPADQVPRISKEHLESAKLRMTMAAYRSEYFCEFGNSQSSLYSTEDIEWMFA